MYTIKLLLKNENNSYTFFNKMFFNKFKAQNIFISYTIKQIQKLEKDEIYIQAKKNYAKFVKDKKKNKKELEETVSIMNERVSYYGLTKKDLETYAKEQQYKYKKYISSQMMQTITNSVLESIQKYLYKDGKQIHYKKFEDIHTVSAKNLVNGIKLDMEYNMCIFPNNFRCTYIFKDYNTYIKECFKKDIPFIKYCRIVKESFNNKYRYYIEFVINSTPILKFNKGNGTCGIDAGVSSIAVTTDKSCMLEDLAPKIKEYNEKIIKVQKKMERSLKLNNKDCYKADGTIKKGSKFKKTKNYKHLRKIFQTLNRKRKCYVKQNQERICNNIIKESDAIFYEEMDFKALGKRVKKNKKQDKMSTVQTKTGEKQIRKFKKKKRFGKSLNNKSPGHFLAILKRRCKFFGVEVLGINTKEFKASQYNHQFDDYRKKTLKDRWNILYDEAFEPLLIQRDLYSSFLIKNSNSDLTHPDRSKCLTDFNNFVEHHNHCIEEILKTNNNRLSCFGF